MKFSQFYAFGPESLVLGDGVGVQCVEASLFCWVDGGNQLFGITSKLIKFCHRCGYTGQGGLLKLLFPGT